jgi:serine/threonine-protein kinase
VSSAIQVGELVAGKYRVDRVLGEGGMGIVVAAMHEQLEQRVALKFLLPSFVSRPEVVQRFLREAKAAVKIHSEHVARVLDVGTHEGSPFMVMEYLEGEDLAHVLADRGPLPIDEAVGYVLQACEAVAEAHSLGVVHRDLKPANLFLAKRPSGRPIIKVLDFGISKASNASDAVITAASTMMGSPSYMPPEQLLAASTVDVRADVWALGIVLFEQLTQRIPFEAETIPELVAAIFHRPALRLTSLRPEMPEGLDAVVDRCLQKERERRFANVAELARALAPFGPPRSEQSVERIEHVLGVAGNAAAPVAQVTSRPPAAPPIEAKTLLPTTSQGVRGTDRRLLWLPLAAALLGALVVILVFRPTSRGAGSAGSAAGIVVPGPTAPAATGEPSARLAETPTAGSTSSPIASASATPGDVRPPASAPWSASSKAPPHTGAPAHSHAAAASAAPGPAPSCHIASYFDADGNKHFKQECP